MVYWYRSYQTQAVYQIKVPSFNHCVNIEGNPQILGSTPSAGPCLPFLLRVLLLWALANSRCVPNLKSLAPAVAEIIVWWALANSSCVPNLKSLASAVAEIIKGKPQISGSSPSPGPHPLFLLVGFHDGPKQTAAAGQIWSRWLHLLRKYKRICF